MISTSIDDDRELGKLLRAHRKRAGLTQRAIADLTNTSPAYICDIEYGNRSLSLRIAKAYTECTGHDFVLELLSRVVPYGYIVTKEEVLQSH